MRLSIPIPSLGRETLRRTLQSCIDGGLMRDDDVIVVADTFRDAQALTRCTELVSETFKDAYSAQVLGFDAGHHAHGNPQRRHAIERATGDFIVGQDEDDIFTPGALQSIREHLIDAPYVSLHLYRFECLIRPPETTPWRQVLPVDWIVAEGRIDGHSLVYPNIPPLLGEWSDRYESDFDFIRTTLMLWGAAVPPFCHDDIIGVARPHEQPYSGVLPA